jgi:osmotically-inducible protein OsmY
MTRRLPLLCMLAWLATACAVLPGDDPTARSVGTIYDDQVVESTGERDIRRAHPELADAHINVTSWNGVVLVSGQVPSEEARSAAEQAILNLRKARRIHNELTVSGPTGTVARTNDAWITSKVKARLIASDDVDGDAIKVVTENGVVFLMGLQTRSGAEAATREAQAIFGVERIVTLFEYLD